MCIQDLGSALFLRYQNKRALNATTFCVEIRCNISRFAEVKLHAARAELAHGCVLEVSIRNGKSVLRKLTSWMKVHGSEKKIGILPLVARSYGGNLCGFLRKIASQLKKSSPPCRNFFRQLFFSCFRERSD